MCISQNMNFHLSYEDDCENYQEDNWNIYSSKAQLCFILKIMKQPL